MILQLQVWSFLLLQEAAVSFDLRSMWNQMGFLAKAVVVVLFIMSAWETLIIGREVLGVSAFH